MGTRVTIPMGITPGKEKGQLYQLQDPSNLGRSHCNVTNVKAGPHIQGMCLAGGHRLEGLKWGCTTSRKGEGPRDSQTKLNDQGVIKRGEGKYYNPDPLYQLIGRISEAKVKINGHEVTGLIDSGANISSILKSFTDKLGLPYRQL